MRYFGILWNGEHIVTGDRPGVSDKKHSVSLSQKNRFCLLAKKGPPVPAITVLSVKIPGHGYKSTPKQQGLSKPLPVGDQDSTHAKTLTLRSRGHTSQRKHITCTPGNTFLRTVREIFAKKSLFQNFRTPFNTYVIMVQFLSNTSGVPPNTSHQTTGMANVGKTLDLIHRMWCIRFLCRK